jgi:hypothetical protein
MDFRDYVNSRDIREYLYKIDYKLSSTQKLDIVEYNNYLTFEQKISLLEELLKENDEKLQCVSFSAEGEYKSYKTKSLHVIIKRKIATYRKRLKLLTKNESGCFYESSLLLDRRDPFGKDKYELKMEDKKLAETMTVSDFGKFNEFVNNYSSPFHRYYANYQDCLNDYLEAVNGIYCEYIKQTFSSQEDLESDEWELDDDYDDCDYDDDSDDDSDEKFKDDVDDDLDTSNIVSKKERLSSLIEKYALTEDDLNKVKRACGIEGAIRKIYLFGKTDNTLQDKNNNVSSGKNQYVSAYLNARGEVKDVLSNIDRLDSFENKIIYTDDPIPVPFKEGDIVSYVHFYSDPSSNGYNVKSASDPFVVTDFLEDEFDHPFFCERISTVDGKSHLLDEDYNYHLYDLEYYRRPLEGKFLALKAIRNFCIDPDNHDERDANLLLEYFDLKAKLDDYEEGVEIASFKVIDSLKEKVDNIFKKIKSKRSLRRIIDEKYRNRTHLRYIGHGECQDCQNIKIYLDDEKLAPKGYEQCSSVKETIELIKLCESSGTYIEEINLDSDLGKYAKDGGDAMKLLDYLVERRTFYKVKLHTSNPEDRANMQKVIDKYWPKGDSI